MKKVLATPPVRRAVDPKDFADRARITTTRDDSTIDQLLDEAQATAESYLGRRLITQTWIAYYDLFEDPLFLPYQPVQSPVTHVKYLDGDGDTQTLSTGTWELGQVKGLAVIRRKYDQVWPTDVRTHEDAIWVEHLVGYGTTGATVPWQITAAIRLHAAFRYRHREDEKIPEAFYNYLRALRVAPFARFRANGEA
jgi:uncharacterized phiE125 gp8 family phage protein